MLYQNVSKYGLATHLALAAALPAALAQFVSDAALSAVTLWASLFACVWMLMEPSVLSGETVSRARSRVLGGIVRDPFAWFLCVAVLFALARWLNSGVKLYFDAEKSIWQVSEPAVSFLPASSGDAALLPLALIVAGAVVVLGVKHALGKNARIWFGIACGAISATGAFAAVVCAGMEIEPFKTLAFSDVGAKFFIGAMYAMFLPISVACGVEAEDRGMTKTRLVFAWAVGGNAVGAFIFLPGFLSFIYLAVSVPIAALALVKLNKRAGAAAAARAGSMIAFGVTIAVFSSILPPYAKIQEAKMAGLDVEKVFTPALADRNGALQSISKSMWLEHPWSGVGVGAFKLQAPFFVQKEDWAVLPPEPSDGSNGYFTLIAERGICGALMCLIGLGFFLYFWISRLIGSFAWHKTQDEGRSWIWCMPTVVWAGPLVLLLVASDAWFSSGFPITALSACVVAAMSLSAASFPKVKRIDKDKEG